MVDRNSLMTISDGDKLNSGYFNDIHHGMYSSWDSLTQLNISASSTASSSGFSSNCKYLYLHNAGTNLVYITADATATSSSFQLNPNERLELFGVFRNISAICDGGKTSTVKVIGSGTTTQAVTSKVYSLNVTSSNGSVSLDAGTDGAVLKNAGTNVIYINVDGAATTNHYSIEPGAYLNIGKAGMSTIQAICDSAKTSTLCIWGFTDW
jgi:hypothetical protein